MVIAGRWGISIFLLGLSATNQLAQAQATTRILSPAEQLTDIAAFRGGFLSLDQAYSSKSRAEAERRLRRLEKTNAPMSPTALLVELCRITALADNGHSSCFFPRSPGLTLGFVLIGDDFYVSAASGDNADLLGAKLIAIDKHPMSSIRLAVRSLFGGIPARRDLRGADVLSRPDLLHAIGIAATADAAIYRMRNTSGRLVDRRLVPSRAGPTWATFPFSDRTSWAFQNREQPFRWRDAPELDAVLVQMRRNYDGTNQKVADFLGDTEASRASLGRKNIVLDMRQNDGGDFLLTRDFMLSWPARVPAEGRFFVLLGPGTFSAGIASVAYLKQAGKDRVTLVGEPPGDRLMFFAEGRLTRLPSTGAEVLPATQRDDFKTGCRKYSDCFAPVAQPGSPTGTPAKDAAILDKTFGRHPLSIRSLAPDLRAPWRISDYETGQDPALAAVANYLKERSNRTRISVTSRPGDRT